MGRKPLWKHIRQNTEPFLDVDHYLWFFNSKRSWNALETSDFPKIVLDQIVSVMDCFFFEKPEIIDDVNLREEPELRIAVALAKLM